MKLYISTNQAATRFLACAGNTDICETTDLLEASNRLAAWLETRHEKDPVASLKLSRAVRGQKLIEDLDATNIHVIFEALFAPLAKGQRDIFVTVEFKPEPAGERETFAEYLARVGKDQAESGREFTARDYELAAARIAGLEAALTLAEKKFATICEDRKLDVISSNQARVGLRSTRAALDEAKVYLHLQD